MISPCVHGCLELYILRIWKIILLTTSIFPSVCGWKVVNLVSFVSIIDHRMDQKVLRNLLSWSEIIFRGIPKWTQTSVKNILVVASVMMLFLHGAKISILDFLKRNKLETQLSIPWPRQGHALRTTRRKLINTTDPYYFENDMKVEI